MAGLDVTKDFTFELVDRDGVHFAITCKDGGFYFFIDGVQLDPLDFQTQSGWTDIRISSVAREFGGFTHRKPSSDDFNGDSRLLF